MIAVAYLPEKKTKRVSGVKRIEVFQKEATLDCVKEWLPGMLAREIVEDGFADDFFVDEYYSRTIHEKEMCVYEGRFAEVPDISVKVYQDGRFARAYIRYISDVNNEDLEFVRKRVLEEGLEPKGLGSKLKRPV